MDETFVRGLVSATNSHIHFLLYTNICTNKYDKFTLKLLWHVSVLIHHLQGVYSCVS